ncbi:MAG: hypothetical protein ACREVE_11970 [Gammaproteobacteria bacterium]
MPDIPIDELHHAVGTEHVVAYVRKHLGLFNDRGSFEGKAEVSDGVLEGLAAANLGYWLSFNRSGSTVNCNHFVGTL